LQNRQNLPDRLGSMLKKSKSNSRHERLAWTLTGWGLELFAFGLVFIIGFAPVGDDFADRFINHLD
jgi:hypothetical protein